VCRRAAKALPLSNHCFAARRYYVTMRPPALPRTSSHAHWPIFFNAFLVNYCEYCIIVYKTFLLTLSQSTLIF